MDNWASNLKPENGLSNVANRWGNYSHCGKVELKVSGSESLGIYETLRETFSTFGEMVHAKIMKYQESGYSKSFRFVKYTTLEDAAKTIEGMYDKFLDGWIIFVKYTKLRQPPTLPSQNNTNFQYDWRWWPGHWALVSM